MSQEQDTFSSAIKVEFPMEEDEVYVRPEDEVPTKEEQTRKEEPRLIPEPS